MLALMPSEPANSSPGANYWYGSSLPNGSDGSPHDDIHPRMMRRASEAVIPSHMFHRQESNPWDHSLGPLHLDTSQVPSLTIRPQSSSASASANAAHKAPLAPKQGLAGSLAGSRAQHQSPISGTYALRTPRGKITSIACESCRKRKSKCDGVRPKCNTCQAKNLSCLYDVAEDGKTTTQLRAHVRRLAKELDDMKSIVSLLAVAPDRATAANWASELEKNGFAHHTAEEIKKSLQDVHDQPHQVPEQDPLGTPGNEPYPRPTQSLAGSSYGGSSRGDSREQSQSALGFQIDNTIDGAAPFIFDTSTEFGKFSFDCGYYRRTKREMLASGWDEAQIFGRHEIDVDTILLGFVDPQDEQPVPTWSSRTVNKILQAAPMPVRLASAFLLTKLMRWLIWPTVENMNAMPEWLMPLPRQSCSPFDILVDLLPWPQLRRHLYQHPGEYPVGTFVGFVGLTWMYADDACHYWDIESGCTRMTPLFKNHVYDLNSWTLDAKALEVIPQLEGLVPMKV
ncbi:hypothetical protein K505DRAFT_342252 [Melanomma pulvis-pyrius CBS 109.77]|uniref:Zn(2)-C6 fungal-type domain-containing protein n=1 Tax=Melanomma pulvis-pyrius CBS 109.77 TaxID=1314802 RepID=A0A6A6WVY0_9PLEO|nr:hypothetical protein K505DRAFT_342252 [Melanomma pulvis-pyrius CBS 109.77]